AEGEQPLLVRPVVAGDEHPAAADHHARQPAAGQFGLPANVLVLTPFHRQPCLGRCPVGPAELSPVGGGRSSHQHARRHNRQARAKRLSHFFSFGGSGVFGAGLGGSGFTGIAFGAVRTVNGTAPPMASHTRHWNDHTSVQSWVASSWHTLIRISLRPFLRVTRATCWSSFIPWWYSSRLNASAPFTYTRTAF